MKKKRTLFTVSGIPTLLMILFVLFLFILALLSLAASKTDLQMSLRSMEQTEQYYAACQTATTLCEETERYVQKLYLTKRNARDFYQELAKISNDIPAALYDAVSHQVTFLIPFSDTQRLHVTLQVSFPETTSNSDTEASSLPLEILLWNTEIFKIPESNYTQPVYKGGAS